MNELSGRVALVSGGARGIGATAAKTLAAAGASVVITDVLEEDGAKTVSEIEGDGGAARFMRHDVTSEEEWNAAVALAKDEFGGLDILVNNAGIFFMKPILEISLEDWQRMSSVNLDGVFLGARAAIPAIAERAGQWPGGGSIINLSSIAGLIGAAGGTAYHMSKGGVRLFTKCLAIECAPMKIRANSVHPGVIETKMGDQVLDVFAKNMGVGANESRAALTTLHPIGRLGVPQDIANAVLFLASDESAFMTGSEVVIDGGFTAQ